MFNVFTGNATLQDYLELAVALIGALLGWLAGRKMGRTDADD